MIRVASRIVNDFSYVMRINHDIHFEWQAPYLLRCVGDACSIYFTGNICASCLLHRLRPFRIRQPKHFVCIAVLHPTAQDLRCLAMHDFFSIGLLVSYRFMFFFIDWKLPPPACPGTTGKYSKHLCFEPLQKIGTCCKKNMLYFAYTFY